MLSVLVPIKITDAMLISSTAVDTGYTAWSGATSYVVGDRVRSDTTHRVYECAAAHTNKDPTNVINRAGIIIYWNDIEATNKWMVFDDFAATQTQATSPLTMVIEPGAFNSVFLGGIDATSLTITVKDFSGGSVIFTETSTLEGSMPDDYYEWCFDPFEPMTNYLVSGIDAYADMELTIALNSASTVKCGIVSIGDLKPIGNALYGLKIKPKTYSRIKVNEYGVTVIVKGKSASDLSLSAYVPLDSANRVKTILTDTLDVPCVWVGHEGEDYEATRVFGLGSGELSYDHLEDCILTLNVNGLI